MQAENFTLVSAAIGNLSVRSGCGGTIGDIIRWRDASNNQSRIQQNISLVKEKKTELRTCKSYGRRLSLF